jgi:hypothetical protein
MYLSFGQILDLDHDAKLADDHAQQIERIVAAIQHHVQQSRRPGPITAAQGVRHFKDVGFVDVGNEAVHVFHADDVVIAHVDSQFLQFAIQQAQVAPDKAGQLVSCSGGNTASLFPSPILYPALQATTALVRG